MIRAPRLVATKPQEQINELRTALVVVVNEANAEIARLERKLLSKEETNGA